MSAEDDYYVSDISSVLATFASGFSCCWLLHNLRGLQTEDKLKLVNRQLWHIAIADLWFALFTLPFFIIAGVTYAGVTMGAEVGIGGLSVCKALGILYGIGIKTSIIVEAHMALYFVAAVYRLQKVLTRLAQSLPWTWLLAAILCAAEMFTGEITYGMHTDHGYVCAPTSHQGFIFILTISISFCACLICGIICGFRVQASGEAVQARIWRRARYYPLVALVTFGPELLAMTGALPRTDVTVLISQTLLCLNGAFNTAVYVLQSRNAIHLSSSRYESLGDLMMPGHLRCDLPSPTQRSPAPSVAPSLSSSICPRMPSQGSYQ